MRRLAQSAASASSDVKILIEQSATEVRNGSKLVSNAAGQLATVLSAADANASLIQSIAKASREQSAAIDEFNIAVRQLDEMTQHNAALVEEINASLEQTETQASQLDMVVDVFTLNGRAPVAAMPAASGSALRSAASKMRETARSYLTQGNAALSKDLSDF